MSGMMSCATAHAFCSGGADDTGGPRGASLEIQPHGFVVCLDEQGRIVQASENVTELVRRPLAEILGSPLESLTGKEPARRIVREIDVPDTEGVLHYAGTMADPRGRQRASLSIAVHRSHGVPVVELEQADSPEYGQEAIHAALGGFVRGLNERAPTDALIDLAVREMRNVTGFGRVLAVRYDDAGEAHVIAEDRDDAYASYLDRRFLATMLPKRGRDRHGCNAIRVVADTQGRATKLIPPRHPATGVSTDLSCAMLRSVSDAQRGWLEEMGARASLSVPIVVRGQVWGALACQHAQPRVPCADVRIACETIGQVLSWRVEAEQAREEADRELVARRALSRVLDAVAGHEQLVDGLCAVPRALLNMVSSCGVAIVFDARVERIGATPDERTVLALADALGADRSGVVATHRLTRDYPDLEAGRKWAGLLAVTLSVQPRRYVIWFRPEHVRRVRGARTPQHAQAPRQGCPIGVRDETARGRACPWRRVEREIASEFRAAMLGVLLCREQERTASLGRANNALEAFSYSVSHDLRAPLRRIAGYGELLAEYEGARMSERGQRFLNNIVDSARFANTLVDDLLMFSQMGHAALRPAAVAMQPLVDSVVSEERADVPGRDITWHVGVLPDVVGDAVFLRLALRNLIANAVKYTRTREHAEIEIGAETSAGEHVFFVRDNGVGFDMKYVHKLFGVFQRLHRAEEFEGTGIGLANVRRVIEGHGGRTWAQGEPEHGATFFFTLPRAPLTEAAPQSS